MKLKLSIILIIISLSLNSTAQRWKAERSSLIFTTGTANYMGDLGGGSKEAAHFLGVRDIDIQGTRFNVGLGYEYRVWERLSVRTSLSYAQLYGSDKFTDNLIRHNRNLHFKSDVWGGDLDFKFFVKRYKILAKYHSGHHPIFHENGVYIIGGFGYFKFAPEISLENEEIFLAQQYTEGESNSYSLNALNYNLGVGINLLVERKAILSIEITNKYTSTDYLDDVSGNYYDNDLLRQEYGDLTANLADRRIDKTIGGTERGNSKYNDSFFFVNFVFQYAIPGVKIRGWSAPKEEKLVE